MNSLEQLEAKMTEELNTYRAWLLAQPPEEILNHAYEYTTKQDIMLNVADAYLSPAQLETMLRSPCPLEDVFKDYRQMDSLSYPAWDFRDAISQRADDAMEQQRSVPIYDGTAREANERGEVEKFKASAEADENCKTPSRMPLPVTTTARGLTQRPRSPKSESSSEKNGSPVSRLRS